MKALSSKGWYCLAATMIFCGGFTVQAQIRFLTCQAVKWPVPPMWLFPTGNVSVAAPPAPVFIPVPQVVPVRPSMDKAELDQHVIAFQKKRAEEGSSSAQYELGMRYLSGNGVEKNVATARKWLQLAAEGGETQAKDKLRELDRRQL